MTTDNYATALTALESAAVDFYHTIEPEGPDAAGFAAVLDTVLVALVSEIEGDSTSKERYRGFFDATLAHLQARIATRRIPEPVE